MHVLACVCQCVGIFFCVLKLPVPVPHYFVFSLCLLILGLTCQFRDSYIMFKHPFLADDGSTNPPSAQGHRRNSFVGTAQYVSPEVLNSKKAYFR